MALAVTTRNDVEAELRAAIWTGRLVDLRTGDAAADDPAQGAGWPAQRTIPAVLLAELLTSTEGAAPAAGVATGRRPHQRPARP